MKGVIYTRDGMSVTDCPLIQFPIVDTETNRATFFTNDHDVRAVWAF